MDLVIAIYSSVGPRLEVVFLTNLQEIHAVGLLNYCRVSQHSLAVTYYCRTIMEGAARVIITQRSWSPVVTLAINRLADSLTQYAILQAIRFKAALVVQGGQVLVMLPARTSVFADGTTETVAKKALHVLPW